jgi:hypothetical protein
VSFGFLFIKVSQINNMLPVFRASHENVVSQINNILPVFRASHENVVSQINNMLSVLEQAMRMLSHK